MKREKLVAVTIQGGDIQVAILKQFSDGLSQSHAHPDGTALLYESRGR